MRDLRVVMRVKLDLIPRRQIIFLHPLPIQGSASCGSVKLSVTFSTPLPSGIGWWSVLRGNPLGGGGFDLHQLTELQVQVDGINVILTLTKSSPRHQFRSAQLGLRGIWS